jgi:hypothetical protein
LARRDHRGLHDGYPSKLSDSMLAYLAVYTLLLLGLMIFIASQ